MIELSAKIVGSSVFLPGDKVVCKLYLRNLSESDGPSKKLEILAWGSAQIHCLCKMNGKTQSSEKENVPTFSDTSFSPYATEGSGQVVLQTEPKIIFCDVQLPAGGSAVFTYTECLPNEAPPSFRGQLVKYAYKVTFGVQRLNSPIKLLRVPLRVLAFSGFPDYTACEDSVDLSPSNPFLETSDKEQELDAAYKLTQNITARRTPNFYNITNARGKVGRFCLFKQAYRLGEDVVGAFDFSKSTVPCFELTVTLQCEERLGDGKSAVQSYSKCHEICLGLRHSHLALPIPLHVTPAFTTPTVTLLWRLHFEFVTGRPGSLDMPTEGSWRAPSSVDIETMVWDLPVQLYPTLPAPDLPINTSHRILF